jgi:hypothetical protein
MSSEKPTDGIRRWGRPSRHRPPGRTATADTAQGERQRAHLPGPPGDIHTARSATDTWHADPAATFPPPDTSQRSSPGDAGSSG